MKFKLSLILIFLIIFSVSVSSLDLGETIIYEFLGGSKVTINQSLIKGTNMSCNDILVDSGDPCNPGSGSGSNGTGNVTGTGTIGYVPVWTSTSHLSDSPISVFSNDVLFTNAIRIGTTTNETEGNVRYISNVFQGYNGTHWIQLSGGAGGISYTSGYGIVITGSEINVSATKCFGANNFSVWNGTGFECNKSSDEDTTYSAGNGIGLTGTTFYVDAGDGLSQDVNGISTSATTAGANQYSYWDGNSWEVRDDDDTTYSAGTGIDLTGTVFSFDTTYGDARYVEVTGDTMTGNLHVETNITSGRLTVGTNMTNDFVLFYENKTGIVRISAENPNNETASVVGVIYEVRNNAGHWGAIGITSQSSTILGGTLADTYQNYNEGYGDFLFTNDGNVSFNWYSDPTDSHNFGALTNKIMELDSSGNLNVKGYIFGQPISGGIDSGIIRAESIDAEARLNVTHGIGLNISYPNFVVRLANTGLNIKICNITNNTVIVPDNAHTVYYIDNNCNVQSTSISNYLSTDFSPGGITDFMSVVSHDGNAYKPIGVEILNKVGIKDKKLLFKTINLDVISGFGWTDNTFPSFNISNGEYVYIRDVVETSDQSIGIDDTLEFIYQSGASWEETDQNGLNVTHCQSGTNLVSCSNPTRYRRHFVFMFGYNNSVDSTEVHQLAANNDISYTNLADCLDTETNALTFNLPDYYTYSVVPLYAYCSQSNAVSWSNGLIDLRTVQAGQASTGIDTNIFLTKDGTRELTANWDVGPYTIKGIFNSTDWSNVTVPIYNRIDSYNISTWDWMNSFFATITNLNNNVTRLEGKIASNNLTQNDIEAFGFNIDAYNSTNGVEGAGFRTATDTDSLILGNVSYNTTPDIVNGIDGQIITPTKVITSNVTSTQIYLGGIIINSSGIYGN